MSPEQASGSSSIDTRSDLYSVGAILYEVVTGRRPFESKNYFQLMKAHVSEAVTPPREVRPGIPEKLDGIILKVLAKDPQERYKTAYEFQSAINELREEIGRETV